MKNKKYKKINVQAGQLIYSLEIAKTTPKKTISKWNYLLNNKRKGKDIKSQEKFYECTFANLRAAYSVRGFFNPTSSQSHQFILEENLSTNTKLLHYKITKLITQVIKTLSRDSDSLHNVKNLLLKYSTRKNYIIPHIIAFDEITSWEDLIELLENLKTTTNEFRFELFVAAICQAENKLQ